MNPETDEVEGSREEVQDVNNGDNNIDNITDSNENDVSNDIIETNDADDNRDNVDTTSSNETGVVEVDVSGDGDNDNHNTEMGGENENESDDSIVLRQPEVVGLAPGNRLVFQDMMDQFYRPDDEEEEEYEEEESSEDAYGSQSETDEDGKVLFLFFCFISNRMMDGESTFRSISSFQRMESYCCWTFWRSCSLTHNVSVMYLWQYNVKSPSTTLRGCKVVTLTNERNMVIRCSTQYYSSLIEGMSTNEDEGENNASSPTTTYDINITTSHSVCR